MRKIPEIYRALRRVAVAAWLCALCACVGMSEDGGCTYEVGSGGDTVEVRLADWHVTGPFTLAQDSLWWRDYMADPLRSTLEANPYNAGGMILLYTSGSGPHFRHVINFPWMHGFRKEMMEVDL